MKSRVAKRWTEQIFKSIIQCFWWWKPNGVSKLGSEGCVGLVWQLVVAHIKGGGYSTLVLPFMTKSIHPCSYPFLAATKQLYEWYFPSVRLSVCLSVCLSVTPFWLCSHHRIIMKFLGVITKDQGKVHAKGQGQRSKVKVTEVTTQLNRFRTVTPVWIHIWWWHDTYSLMLLRRGALLFFKVIRQI